MKGSIYLNNVEIPEFRSRYIRNDDCLCEFCDSWIEFLSYFILPTRHSCVINSVCHSCACRNLACGYAVINEIPVSHIASQNFNRKNGTYSFLCVIPDEAQRSSGIYLSAKN